MITDKVVNVADQTRTARISPLRQQGLLLAVSLLLSVTSAFGAQLVTSEAARIEILKAAFPHAEVSVSQQTPLDWEPYPWPGAELTDALAGEREYRVFSPPDKFERGWANDMADTADIEHNERRVRIRAYRLNSPAEQYAVLAHYQFVGIDTHMPCCEWFARLFILSRKDGLWTERHTGASLMYRAKTVRSFRVMDLAGDGQDDILIEAERAEATYRSRITMSIFKIAQGQLLRVAAVDTLTTDNSVRLQSSRELDLEKTRRIAGKAFYFKTVVYGTDDEQFPTPRVEQEVVKSAP